MLLAPGTRPTGTGTEDAEDSDMLDAVLSRVVRPRARPMGRRAGSMLKKCNLENSN